MEDFKVRGTVKFFDSRKRWGFITRDDGIDYFVHFTSILMQGRKQLSENDIVEFEIGNGTTGREQAVNVTPILTVKSIIESLKEENLKLKTMTDAYGVKKYLVVNTDDVLQTDENGMTLVETAAYAGIDVEGLE